MRLFVDVPRCALLSTVLLGAGFACGPGDISGGSDGPIGSASSELVLEDRALAVTDQVILEPFTLEQVLQQIINTSGVSGVTPLSLFQQWWDTQNLGPSLGVGPHCDDETTGGVPSLNGFPWQCPRGEGFQAFVDPFGRDPLYEPIGLFNRFDLAPGDGSHCGEYRIVFAMRPDHPDSHGGRNLLIFEAVLPNPDPAAGLAGCYPVAEFWYNLSFENNWQARQQALLSFYFNGLPGFEPVVHVDHYGTQLSDNGYGCSTGQIRTNQFIDGEWNLREFRMVHDCRCGNCFLVIAPTTVKDNPFGELFDGNSGHPLAPTLQSQVINSVWSLGNGGVTDIGWTVPNKVNSGESLSVQGGPYDYLNIFTASAGSTFFNDVDNEANLVWGGLFHGEHIVSRAETQSCAGCHHVSNSVDVGNGVIWPDSNKFVHVDETNVVFGPIGPRYDISVALQKEFLPKRAKILEDFVMSGGTAPGNATRCSFPIPRELAVDCATPAARDVSLRPFKVTGLEKLKPRLLSSIGGARVH